MRSMATVVSIDEVRSHPNADSLELCMIGGWQCVSRIGEFKSGDKAIYCQIDSWIPTEIAPFLSKGKSPKMFNGVSGERLRTVKLRGELSQGLLLPVTLVADEFRVVGTNVEGLLNIQKWEAPIPAQLAGVMKGNFPSFIRKTDQERIQGLKRELADWKNNSTRWEVTEKLEGSSCTIYYNDGVFGVCSRNIDLLKDEANTFWKVAIKYDLENKLTLLGKNIAVQGELIGSGVQGNIYNLADHKLMVFDIFDIDTQTYFSSDERIKFANEHGLDHAPVLGVTVLDEQVSMNDLLNSADGKSALYDTLREGLVFKNIENPNVSFKVISNQYLLGEK